MQYLFMALFAAGIVAADQISKYLTVMNIAASCGLCADTNHMEVLKETYNLVDTQLAGLPERIEVIPGLFHFSHAHNEGAAWSSFEGMTWLFVLIFAGFAAFIAWEFPKKKMPFTAFERWCIVAVFAGGLGNMIDRLRLGYVVDMIEVDFMTFPVFNVADCFITCGAIALLVHLVFWNRSFWKDEKAT